MKKYQLPKEFAQKWVDALRSGEYKQGIKALKMKDHDAYCCLGVCAIVNGFTDKTRLEDNGELGELGRYTDEYEECFQYDLLEYGIPIALLRGDLPDNLIYLNDNQNKSFQEIADWIEYNVEFI